MIQEGFEPPSAHGREPWSLPIKLLYLVAGIGFEPMTSGYVPAELPDCSTPRFI
ncbi:hypothetical protein CPAV1605_993 [seawater metagenome]|uniref:Uncharacterized protein n=1 Tax=seawater metagenome TaxID=1561972 RepID=A0A5E8CIR3_9ZZZZ